MTIRATLMSSVWLVGFVSGPAHADSLDEQFTRANQAFFAGDLDRAVQQYRALADSGVEDPDLSYNLGTAYAHKGQYGRAIQFYERALKLRPRDPDVTSNLLLTRGLLARKLVARHLEASMEERPPFYRALADGITTNAIAIVFLAFYAFSFGLLFGRRWLGSRAGGHKGRDLEVPRLAVGVALALSILGTLACAGLLSSKLWAEHAAHEAVIVAEEAHASTGPGDEYDEAFSLVEGTRVRLLGREGRWILVRGPAAREGWLPRKDVGSI